MCQRKIDCPKILNGACVDKVPHGAIGDNISRCKVVELELF